MHPTGTADRLKILLLWLGGITGALALGLLLSHGTTGGDEGGVLEFMHVLQTSGWRGLSGSEGGHDFLAHRLFWLGEKIAWNAVVTAVLPASLLASASQYNYFMVLDDTLFMLAAFAVMVAHISRRYTPAIAVLATSAIMIASSGIGLFAGGFSECIMSLLVVSLAVQLDRNGPLPAWRFALLILSGLGLIASKLYAAPFVLALALLVPGSRRSKLLYGAIFLIAPLAWLQIQSAVRASASSGMMTFYVSLMEDRNITVLLSESAAFFFSLSFGILPCFPLLLLAGFCSPAKRRTLAIKIAALLGIAVLLLPFPFWAGPGGLGGPRYIYPFLLVLIPEVADGLRNLSAVPQRRATLFAIPAAALLFLPSLEYRNSLAGRYADSMIRVSDLKWPHTEAAMHPALFGWKAALAKQAGKGQVSLSRAQSLTADVQDIFPMTALSRVIYVLGFDGAAPAEIRTVKDMLARHGMDRIWPWAALRAILAILLLGGLTWAAWPRRQSQ